MEDVIIKYPRTQHIQGSNLQKGDEDLSQISFETIKNKFIVIEEKVDGANVAISFNSDDKLLLQSRGRFLTGGSREYHYNLFKQWANNFKDDFLFVLGDRYIMYGEWLYSKHSLYYDALPHYFMEFDVFDKKEQVFLDSNRRKEMLKDLPVISVPILATGKFEKMEDVLKYLTNSLYKTDKNIENLRQEAIKMNLDPEQIVKETDNSMLMEGLYIKVEEDGIVKDRMKYVRNSFKQNMEVSDKDWLVRPVIQNKLDKDINELFKY